MSLINSVTVIIFFITSLHFSSISSLQSPKHYVVYMGRPVEDDLQTGEAFYLQMMDTFLPREESDERREVVHHYKHALRGFSAMLTDQEAALISRHEEVVSVFEDPMLQLHTTRSWDFLQSISGLPSSFPIYTNNNNNHINGSSDIIIGVVDTGIWPESPSFNDKGFGDIPSKWKGICMTTPDFKSSSCNKKLIGVRYYKSTGATSARDNVDHGTHTASTAGGAIVHGANDRGLALGTATGGQPGSRIAVYKVCNTDGCSGSALLKAIDDAIHDGVDLISISIGMTSGELDYLSDPIAIGSFHAELKGISVIVSAGNNGPDPSTVGNVAPWVFTVAASNIDRDFQSSIVLGNGRVLRGAGIYTSNATRPKAYPLVYSRNVADAAAPLAEARTCSPGSLDRKKVAGKVIVCVKSSKVVVPKRLIKEVVEDLGAKGVILVNRKASILPFDSDGFPFSEVDTINGYKILTYILNTKSPKVTILPTVEIKRSKPAPVVAPFSSRGPATLTHNILKPDIMAPGVLILAAVRPPKTAKKSTPTFGLRSGTSMACPHVTGAAAYIKSLRPNWTPSMIKSALMTTAIPYDNMRRAVTNTSGLTSTPHETGAGEIDPPRAADPGLVFETTKQDYLRFLCYYGYSQETIRKTLTKSKFTCTQKGSKELISTINYPSISIGKLRRAQRHSKMIERTVTNVGAKKNVTYVSHIVAPKGLLVKVEPERIVFDEHVNKVTFRVWFNGKKTATKGYHHGSLEWSDGYHLVRSVFSVNID